MKGLEPLTYRLSSDCSTTELHRCGADGEFLPPISPSKLGAVFLVILVILINLHQHNIKFIHQTSICSKVYNGELQNRPKPILFLLDTHRCSLWEIFIVSYPFVYILDLFNGTFLRCLANLVCISITP